MRESELERYLVKAVAASGGKTYKWVSPNRRGANDRIVVLPIVYFAVAAAPSRGRRFPPRIVFVELKTATGRVSKHQERQHTELQLMGCEVRTCRTSEDVDRMLEWA